MAKRGWPANRDETAIEENQRGTDRAHDDDANSGHLNASGDPAEDRINGLSRGSGMRLGSGRKVNRQGGGSGQNQGSGQGMAQHGRSSALDRHAFASPF